MVMMIDPLQQAIAAARAALGGDAKVIFLSPQGRRFNHRVALELAREPALVLIAGRYEGVDERLLEAEVDEELSIGDYVLSGGELAAMVVIDAITRQLPGALGHELSAQEDSFADGLLDCPHYTRPEVYQGRQVPEVLLSGNHEEIRRWRLKQALGRTRERRPDLLEGRALTPEEEQLLAEYLRQRDTSTDNQL
jgi:tRNA (guanine37-N1)-methyltransferase